MSDDETPGRANEAQYAAGARWAARLRRPRNKRDAWRAFETDEQQQDNRWYAGGGNQ